MTHYIFVTGGVVSSLGKGITSASLAADLKARGYDVTLIKLDPYINVDPGTMSPFQHGEVFVTEDGAETDVDLGNYERFLGVKMSRKNNLTAGAVYAEVIRRERRGDYLGATVQVIPHITDEIKSCIKAGAKNKDIAIIEVGGTVGDIESLPFLEAIRQMRIELSADKTLFIHLTLVPYLPSAGEIKTKPTQHSVKELCSLGIQPDILMCRSVHALSLHDREKIALFTNVEVRGIVSLPDVKNIYQVPLLLEEQGIGDLVTEKLFDKKQTANLTLWRKIVEILDAPRKIVKVAMVGKYVDLTDAYKSINEALCHAGIHTQSKVEIIFIDAETLEAEGVKILQDADAILVPGGFGKRGIEGMILAAEYARKNKIPYLGICLGLQVAIIEFARHVAKMPGANSTEFDAETKYPVVALINEWLAQDGSIEQRDPTTDLGATMRLGGYACHLVKDTLIRRIYNQDVIVERFRHRYEVNGHLAIKLAEQGLVISGVSEDGNLVEAIELEGHPWYFGCQFHPEFTSNPHSGHPVFISYIQAALAFTPAPSKLCI